MPGIPQNFYQASPSLLLQPQSKKIPHEQNRHNQSKCSPKEILSSLHHLLLNTFSTQSPSHPSALPSQVDLKSSSASHSFGSSPAPTATIPGQDVPVFTTDSQQSPWLPSSSPSLPASSAQQQHYQQLPPQQDFVLFDTPRRSHQPSRSISHSSIIGSASRKYHHPSASPSTQNKRVAQIIQATGHSTTSQAFTNRFNNTQQLPQTSNQFYASSAPSSTVALPQDHTRPRRPPVPLFDQSTGNTQARLKMNDSSDLGFDDFAVFGGGSSAFPSPAMPAVFDVGSAAASSMGTVSPQDLHLQDPYIMSAPNSTAITSLTSPSMYNGSPELCEGFDGSPLIGNDLDAPWFPPLFPQENNSVAVAVEQTSDSVDVAYNPLQSPETGSEDLETPLSPAPRRKSEQSPTSGRHSSVAGVNARRRDKPLPPIVVTDPTDVVAMKRARNTLAARKSRERKAMRFEELEEKIAKLEAERDHWRKLAQEYGAP